MPKGASKDPGQDVVVDETVDAAKGYRTAASGLVAALALAPLVTVLGSLVALPDDHEWSKATVIVAGVLIVVSVLTGLYLSVWLRLPVELQDTDTAIKDFPMSRIPWLRYSTFAELRSGQKDLVDRHPRSADENLDLQGHNQTIAAVYRLATASVLGQRIRSTRVIVGTGVAVLAGVAAVVALILAPQPTEESQEIRLVSVTLKDPAVKRFGCSAKTFTALRVSGTDDEPQVVPLSVTCKSGLLKLKTEKKATATVADVKPAGD